jgi:DDE superfamily endonuclease
MLDAGEKGVKRSKSRITGVLITNLSGTEKRTPIIIGKAKRPQCWKSRNLSSLPVKYVHSQKAWMTGYLFQDILLELNRDMKNQNRKILLIVDGAGIQSSSSVLSFYFCIQPCSCLSFSFSFATVFIFHGSFSLRIIFTGSHLMCEEVETLLANVHVLWLPPNCTSMLQPLDQGIIHSLKAKYRKLLLRHLISYMEVKKVSISLLFMHACCVVLCFVVLTCLNQCLPNLTIDDAARFLSDAWHSVSGSTIRHCWSHSGIVPDEYQAELNLLDQYDDSEAVLEEVQDMIDELRKNRSEEFENPSTAREYVDVDDDEV